MISIEASEIWGGLSEFFKQYDRLRSRADMAEGECERLRDELSQLRAETETYHREREEIADSLSKSLDSRNRADMAELRAETETYRREREGLRDELSQLRAETETYHREREEIADSLSKSLDSLSQLVDAFLARLPVSSRGSLIPAKPPRNRAKRSYQRSGLNVVSKALPYLLERVADSAVPDEALSPVERAARDWRRDVLVDQGDAEHVSAAKMALVDVATRSKIVVDSLDRYLFELAENSGLVNRRNRRVFAIVQDRMRVADSFARQLQALGLERMGKPSISLQDPT